MLKLKIQHTHAKITRYLEHIYKIAKSAAKALVQMITNM